MGHKIPWGRDAILFPYKTSDHRKEQERGRQMFYMIFQVQTWMEREVEVLRSLKGKTTGNSSLPLPKLEKPSSFREVQQADISVYLELSVLWTCPPCVCLFVCFLINIFYLEANCFIILWWFFAIHWHESATGVHVSPIPKPLPPPSPSHPSGLSQCTSFECPVSCIELGLVIYFTYGNIHVSMLFSQIIPPSPFPTESKSLFFTSVSLLLSCT